MKFFNGLIIGCLMVNFAIGQIDTVKQHPILELTKPFLGVWEEYTVEDNKEIFIGELQSKEELDGHVLMPNFVSKDSTFSFSSFGYYHQGTHTIEEIYVFNNGRVAEYRWLKGGPDVLLRRTGGTRDHDYMQQLRLTSVDENGYQVVEAHDEGETWTRVELTQVKRKQ